jgi:hypothetical protein
MRMNSYIWLSLLLGLLLPAITQATGEREQIEPKDANNIKAQSISREIGYRVGDVVRQIIHIETPSDYRFDQTSLPAKGRSAGPVELRDASWQFENRNNVVQHTLIIDWQIFQVLQEVRAFPLLPLQLKFRRDDHVLVADLDAANVIVSTLLPTRLDAARLKPFPDVEPQPRETLILMWWLTTTLMLVLLTLIYFAWYFDLLKIKFLWGRPYRIACREIRKLRRQHGEATQKSEAAMRYLRRACDHTAGAALSRERLYLLFESHPWLLPLRAELEQLYSDSDQVFFAGYPVEKDIESIYRLGKKLRALESGGGWNGSA